MQNSISLFQFQNKEIRTVQIEGEPWFVAIDICRILEISNSSDALRRISEEDKGSVVLTDPLGNDKNHSLINESGLYDLVLRSRKEVAKPFRRWVTSEVLPSIRKTGKYQIQALEKQFQPSASIKEIGEMTKLFDEFYGRSYSQRYLFQQTKRHFPQLLGEEPLPEERASIATVKALLNPTQIAKELQLYYKTGNPNPKAANLLLAKLGYQSKIDGEWNPTEKAITLKLCDRKPVETGSRTQKDQLLWSVDILPLLQEHAIA